MNWILSKAYYYIFFLLIGTYRSQFSIFVTENTYYNFDYRIVNTILIYIYRFFD